MQKKLKERLVGAATLVGIAVIFIPMVFTGPIDIQTITETNIPKKPVKKFVSVPAINPVKKKTEVRVTDKNSDIDVEIFNMEQDVSSDLTTENNIKKSLSAWVVQLGSFSKKENADRLNLSLRKMGFPAFVEQLKQDKNTIYRVRVGPELLRSDADRLLEKIRAQAGQDGIVLVYRN